MAIKSHGQKRFKVLKCIGCKPQNLTDIKNIKVETETSIRQFNLAECVHRQRKDTTGRWTSNPQCGSVHVYTIKQT